MLRRESKTLLLHVRVDRNIKRQLDEHCAAQDRPVSQFVREAVLEKLSRERTTHVTTDYQLVIGGVRD